MNQTASLSPSERFTSLIEGLMQDAAGDAPTGWFPIPLIRLLFRRLRQLSDRFAAILARFHAGTLPKPTPPPAEPRPAPAPANPSPSPHPSHGPRPKDLPRRIGWTFRKLSYAGVRRDQLEDLLADPEMAALVADAPQLGRSLRPLCRMLGVKPPDWLRLPQRPRRPRPVRHRTMLRLGASQNWRRPCLTWPTREEAEKYDAKTWVWDDER